MPPTARQLLFMDDEKLLSHVRLEVHKTGGPGGQKRNKTSTAVRIVEPSTHLTATASENRSLSENKLFAFRRIRLRIAADVREAVDPASFAPPDWFLSIRRDRKLEVSHRHTLYAPAAALALDLLSALHGNPAAVAVNLGVSTTSIIRLLESDDHLWTAANKIRVDNAQKPLERRGR